MLYTLRNRYSFQPSLCLDACFIFGLEVLTAVTHLGLSSPMDSHVGGAECKLREGALSFSRGTGVPRGRNRSRVLKQQHPAVQDKAV